MTVLEGRTFNFWIKIFVLVSISTNFTLTVETEQCLKTLFNSKTNHSLEFCGLWNCSDTGKVKILKSIQIKL